MSFYRLLKMVSLENGISRNVISRNGRLIPRSRPISDSYLNKFTVCKRLKRGATPDLVRATDFIESTQATRQLTAAIQQTCSILV